MHSLYPNPQNGIPFEHLVFLNNGDGTFTDFSDESGLRHYQVGFFAFGDLDNDGDQDIFGGLDIGLGSPHEVLINDGTGRFLAKADSGLEGEWNTIAGNALLADFNGDANLDLYIGNGHTTSAAPDSYWLGNGDGSFQKATSALQGTLLHPSNGLVACDYDADGDLDIFVSTYGVSQAKGHNILWENNGDGTFQNVAQQRGFHAQEGGNTFLQETDFGASFEGVPVDQWMGSNGFGLACEDINGDGFLDIFLATISHPVASDYNRKWSDPSQVLINQGPEEGYRFVNQAKSLGLPFNEGDIDAAAVDFDNDGRIDLALTRDSKYEKYYEGLEQKSWFGLFHQGPEGSFTSSIQENGINGLDITLEASLDPCATDGDCSGGEICHNDKCRTPCASNAECTSENEICHPGGFCKGLARMKKGQNQSWRISIGMEIWTCWWAVGITVEDAPISFSEMMWGIPADGWDWTSRAMGPTSIVTPLVHRFASSGRRVQSCEPFRKSRYLQLRGWAKSLVRFGRGPLLVHHSGPLAQWRVRLL